MSSPPTLTARPPGAAPSRRRLLGDLLIEEGLITSLQLEDALRSQTAGEVPRPLGEILVEQQAITQRELNVVLDKYRKKYRLGDLLVETNAITEEQLAAALEHQKETDLRLGDVLLKLNLLTERQMKQALCRQLGARFVDLDTAVIDPGLSQLVTKDWATQHRVVPLERTEDRIAVAMDDPGDLEVVHWLESATGCRIDVVASTDAAFRRAFARVYEASPVPEAAPDGATTPVAELLAERDGLRRERDAAARALRDLEARHAEMARALTDLQVAHEALRREGDAAAGALQDLGPRHAETTERLRQLVAQHAELRRAHEAALGALREQRQRYEAALRDRKGRDDIDVVLRQLSPAPPRRRPRSG
ncbi:MAG TPA: hypothetical protein VGW35_14105 [Methylomirabilota bacterium]|nr:hypothetical protein [Methylomirabilota bacterium]